MSEPRHDLRPKSPRWTHTALRVADIQATIDWYPEFTPLELLDRREDDDGYGAWLGHSDSGEFPFILVIAQFHPHRDPFAPAPISSTGPFNHMGIEMPDREGVDEVARRVPRPATAWRCLRPRCPTRSATSACSVTLTGTWSSSPSIRASTKKCVRCGATHRATGATSLRIHRCDCPQLRPRSWGQLRLSRDSLEQRRDLGHVLETVFRGRWVLVGRHRQPQLHPADVAAIPAIHLSEFTARRGLRRHRRHGTQHHDAGLPQDVADDDGEPHPDDGRERRHDVTLAVTGFLGDTNV